MIVQLLSNLQSAHAAHVYRSNHTMLCRTRARASNDIVLLPRVHATCTGTRYMYSYATHVLVRNTCTGTDLLEERFHLGAVSLLGLEPLLLGLGAKLQRLIHRRSTNQITRLGGRETT